MSDPHSVQSLSVLIIGCGAIAGGYDEKKGTGSGAVLSHAGAYSAHPGFHIRACVDPDTERRQRFMKHWSVDRGFDDLGQCMDSGLEFDVASLCIPSAAHAMALNHLLEMPIRAVLSEKPLTGNIEESRRIIKSYGEKKRPLIVNYMRRWDPMMATLRADIAAGKWGAVQYITGHYTKGLFNCASHMIDLLHFLVGPLEARSVLGRINDYTPDDPTISAILGTESGAPVYLLGSDSRNFFTFEIDLMMEKGRLVLEDLGGRLRRREIGPHPLFTSQITLEHGQWEDTGCFNAMESLIANLYDHLARGTPLGGDAETALAAEQVCADILELGEFN